MTKRGIDPKTAQKIRSEKGIEDTKLQKLRVKKGLSQNDLSVISGVTKRAIQCYEQQTRIIDNASLEKLCDLCLALDCSIEDILENEKLIAKYRLVK